MRTRFVLSETFIGLRRNLSMTIAVVMTVAISLFLMGVALLVREQIDKTKGFYYGNIEVSVYLNTNVTQTESDNVRSVLTGLPDVAHVYYVSPGQAYERAQVLFRSTPQLLKNIKRDTLPASYLVKLKDPKKFAIVAAAVQTLPGVDEVADASSVLKKMFRLLDGMQTLALAFALVFLAVAVLLIFNTVRLSAFSRRRETGIMRLVGASNLFIQGPFVLEGAAAGFVGALLAIGALALFQSLVIFHGLQALAPNLTPYIGWHNVLMQIPVLVVFGLFVAGGIAGATLQRYLRV